MEHERIKQRKRIIFINLFKKRSNFFKFAEGYDSGFIVYPHFNTPHSKNTYKVFCSFPLDAHTDNRDDHGCGLSIGDKTKKSRPCHKQQIDSIKKWKKHFEEIMSSEDNNFVTRQCGFDMTKEDSIKYFNISLQANKDYLKTNDKYSSRNNEIKMHIWNENNEKKYPSRLFFICRDLKMAVIMP